MIQIWSEVDVSLGTYLYLWLPFVFQEPKQNKMEETAANASEVSEVNISGSSLN